ncbi:hypothetical protein D3C71_1145640 [compost metagenome]
MLATILGIGFSGYSIYKKLSVSEIKLDYFDLPQKQVMGSPDTKDTLYFVFDYTCPACKKWEEEVYPVLYKDLISKEKLNFVSQPIPLLSKESLKAAEVDYAVGQLYTSRYYEIQQKLMQDSKSHKDEDKGDWATDQYYERIFTELGEDYEKIKGVKVPDQLSMMRNFTKNLGVASVPTVYLNGYKLADPFDINTVKSVIDGKTKLIAEKK